MARKENPHIGSSFDDFLEEEGIKEEVNAVAIKRTIALQLESAMAAQKLSKAEVARRMRTSAMQLDRILDPAYSGVKLETLLKAARAVGKKLEIQLV